MEINATYIILFAICGLIIGFAKTGMPGAGILAVPIIAMLFSDSREAMGALLPLLIVGDIFAVRYYHRQANWAVMLRLVPWVVVGVVAAAFATPYIGGSLHAWSLGVIVLAMAGFELVRQAGWVKLDHVPHSLWFRILTGLLAGFTTMIGNAAGPIMGIYFLSIGFKKDEFMGTGAWYFLLLNCFKVPFCFYPARWITHESLVFDLKMAPLVIVGAFVGAWVHPKIKQKIFPVLVLVLAIAAALNLLISAWSKSHHMPTRGPAASASVAPASVAPTSLAPTSTTAPANDPATRVVPPLAGEADRLLPLPTLPAPPAPEPEPTP